MAMIRIIDEYVYFKSLIIRMSIFLYLKKILCYIICILSTTDKPFVLIDSSRPFDIMKLACQKTQKEEERKHLFFGTRKRI